LGLAAFVVGMQGVFLGAIAQILFDYTGRTRQRWLNAFPYTRTVLLAVLLVLTGIGLAVPLAVAYVNNSLALTSANLAQDHLAVTGLVAGVGGVELFIFELLMQGAVVATAGLRRDGRC
jgi:hypothetical protein